MAHRTVQQRPVDTPLAPLGRLFLEFDKVDLGIVHCSAKLRQARLIEVGDAQRHLQRARQSRDCEVVGFARDGLRATSGVSESGQ